MKILIVGAGGTIGSYVSRFFSQREHVITAGRSSGDVRVDISDPVSIGKMYADIGLLDAVINLAGEAKWAPYETLSEVDYYSGIRSKLMGQVNLALQGLDYLSEGGSITLSTGILADHPVPKTTSAAMVNGAIHSFVQALELELPKSKRVNAVSLGVVEDAYEKYRDFFPGHPPISMEQAAEAYTRCVYGNGSGEIIRVYPALSGNE